MRLRIIFAKTEAMRFTGHLDLFRTLERTMRRANLPLAYSEGFVPHPKINLASALPLGYTSEYEVADCWLKEPMPAEQVETALRAAAAPGTAFLQVEEIPDAAPKLQNTLSSAEFVITLLDSAPGLEEKIATLLAAAELPRQKVRKGKAKAFDLRPLILALDVIENDAAGLQRLKMSLTAQESLTGRPDDVLGALGIDPLRARIHRTRLVFSTNHE